MKKNKIIIVTGIALVTVLLGSGFTLEKKSYRKTVEQPLEVKQTINMFVTHGHCSTPFAGNIDRLTVDFGALREDGGNPVENMKMSFEINPNTFNVCASDELTTKIKTPGLFIGKDNENIIFTSTNVYTMGLNWYQVNGKLSIKGEERNVKFFVTGLRDPKESRPSAMVLEGQFNLKDWGIDYDKIVNGKSDNVPTKMVHLNMRFDLC
ncbi:MAG: YceI family protein [Vicingaceae bacterium]